MVRSARARLMDIGDTIKQINASIRGRSQSDLTTDWVFAQACERAILIIAEASKHLPSEIRAMAPEIPWSDAIAMGNLLRHEYFRIDSDVVWVKLTKQLPLLHSAIIRILVNDAHSNHSV